MTIKRIAYLLPAPGVPVQGPSGASAHARSMASALSLNHDVRLYAARDTDRRGTFGPTTPNTCCGTPGWPSWLRQYREIAEIWAGRRIARCVLEDAHRGWRPDLIIERHSLFSDAGWRISSRLNIPWILEVNAPPVLERSRFEQIVQHKWALQWEKSVLRAAPTIVTVSRWLVSWLTEEIGCSNVIWIPNGVDAVQGDRDEGRKMLKASPDEMLVGFVGSMKPWHGVDRLQHIAKGADARLVVLGHIPEHASSLPDNAICPGHLTGAEFANAVAALDVGLAPYPADAPSWFCPLKILEYRAQGVPVVASDIGDARRLVAEGGDVVDPGDLNGFIDAVQSWKGRKTKPKVRGWQTVAQQILDTAN